MLCGVVVLEVVMSIVEHDRAVRRGVVVVEVVVSLVAHVRGVF